MVRTYLDMRAQCLSAVPSACRGGLEQEITELLPSQIYAMRTQSPLHDD